MKNFIEILVNGEKCIVNINAIQNVCPLEEGGCTINLLEGSIKCIRTEMDYEELSKILLGD